MTSRPGHVTFFWIQIPVNAPNNTKFGKHTITNDSNALVKLQCDFTKLGRILEDFVSLLYIICIELIIREMWLNCGNMCILVYVLLVIGIALNLVRTSKPMMENQFEIFKSIVD